MFTGIIEEVGKIQSVSQNKIFVTADKVIQSAKIGDSIAVSGVCLTVTKIYQGGFEADVSDETMKVTVIGKLTSGSYVNLERAIRADGRFDGHIVSGHVDGKGRVKNIKKDGEFYTFEFEYSSELAKYTVKKGSTAINGISLTVADIEGNNVKIAVIPHTFENTNLKYLKTGDYVNIETDVLSKYVEKFLSTSDNKTGINMDFLMEHGF